MSLAIVIPTLDEESMIGPTLAATRPHLRFDQGDLLVVSDGGSQDRTLDHVRREGAEIIEGSPGRGSQLARGSRYAIERGATVLLFLHADSRLPAGARERVEQCLASGAVGGGFLVAFAPATPVMRLGSSLVGIRTRLLRLPLGDQAQFATVDAYLRAGGFPDWPLLEDLELLRRLKRLGRVAIIGLEVETAARRFAERGVARTIATNWLIWGLYSVGVHPRTLARLYRRVR